MFPFLLLLFFLVPLIEIYLLIEIGGVIGVGWTIFCVVFTAVLGAILVRAQGFSTVNRIRNHLQQGQLPAIEMLEGLCLLVAGALLLTPGFFTDAVGFILLTPPLRRLLIQYFLSRGGVLRSDQDTAPPKPSPQQTLEGEFKRVDD